MTNLNTSMAEAPESRNIKPVVIMLLLFALPYLISWYYMYSDEPIIEISPSNKGLLVSPMRLLDDLPLEFTSSSYAELPSQNEVSISGQAAVSDGSFTAQPGTATTADWKGSWTMVTVIDSACEVPCQKALFTIGQVRRAMGVGRDRVNRVAIVTDSLSMATVDQRAKDYPGTEFVVAPRTSIDRLLSQFSGVVPLLTNGIFLIDPQGYFMMAYSADMPAKYLLDDMERLFKVNKQ